MGPYFHIPAPIPALPDGDPAIIEAVTRTPRYSSSPDQLSARIDGHRTQMIYDMKHDAFVKLDSLNEVDPVRYVARTGSTDLVPVAPGGKSATPRAPPPCAPLVSTCRCRSSCHRGLEPAPALYQRRSRASG